jgi:hypothetical protein
MSSQILPLTRGGIRLVKFLKYGLQGCQFQYGDGEFNLGDG